MKSELQEFYSMSIKQGTAVVTYANDPVCMAFLMTDPEYPDDYASPITVNLGSDIGNEVIMPKYCAFLDTNNYPDIDTFLQNEGIAEPYVRRGYPVVAQSGFCQYPLYRFNEEKLKELGTKGLDLYEKDYEKGFVEVQRAMFGDFDYEEESEAEVVLD